LNTKQGDGNLKHLIAQKRKEHRMKKILAIGLTGLILSCGDVDQQISKYEDWKNSQKQNQKHDNNNQQTTGQQNAPVSPPVAEQPRSTVRVENKQNNKTKTTVHTDDTILENKTIVADVTQPQTQLETVEQPAVSQQIVEQSTEPVKGHKYYRLLIVRRIGYFLGNQMGGTDGWVNEIQFKWNNKWQVNNMGSYSEGTIGEVRAIVSGGANDINGPYWRAFDGSDGSAWCTSGYPTGDQWLEVEFDQQVDITGFKLLSNSLAGTNNKKSMYPTDFIFQFSDDKVNWINVTVQVEQTPTTTKEYDW
jgi:hypothetical protein